MIKSLKSILNSSDSHQLSLEEFNALYKEHNEFIRKSIYWMTRVDNIDDIVQDTFYKAWRSRASFKNNSSYKTWIYKIAMNCCYDFLKKENKNKEIDFEQKQYDTEENTNKDLISKALKALKPKTREIFILFYKFGYTLEEISNLTGQKLGTIKSQMYYGKKDFSNFLKENGVMDE